MAQRGGQPGNNNANRGKPWRAAIDRAIAQGDADRLRRIAEKLLDLAAAGDIQAIKELGDRLDGKAVQAVIGDPEQPLVHRIERVIIDPDASDA